MRSFTITLIIAALAAFASAAPIVNGDASIKDAAPLSDGHQSLSSSISARDVVDNLVGQLKSHLQGRAVTPDSVKGSLSGLGAEVNSQYNNRRDLLGNLENELGGGLESRSSAVDPSDILKAIKHKIKHDARSLNSVGGSLSAPDTLDGVPSDAEGTLESLHLAGRETVAGLKGKVNGLLSSLKRDVIGDAEGDVKSALSGRDLVTDLKDKLTGVLSNARA